jgi:hypothetical protein
VLGLALTLLLAGCGLGPTGGPADEGDGLAGGVSVADSEVKNPLPPDSASTPAGLVTDFLRAASGGQRPATDRVKAFLTENALQSYALQSWRDPVNPDNPQLSIIRVVGGPSANKLPVGNRTPVEVNYQTVGTLNDQGRVDVLQELQAGTMTVWVVPDERNPSNLRVDEIEFFDAQPPPGLMLSDDALTEYYRIQPVYFWDQSYSALVPDLRYLPLTITPDLRANRVVQWLVAGPSPWLAGAQKLPLGTAPEQVVTENGKLVVRFNAEVAAGGSERLESLRRLLFQLQWSLRTNTTPALELRIDNKVERPANDVDYLPFNLTSGYGTSGQRYDIGPDQKVVANPPSAAAQAVLAAPENQSVVWAAIGGGGTIAAYVRLDVNGRRRLWLLRGGKADEVALNPSTTMGRPVFVSPAGAHLLITSGGRLYSVSTVDGTVTDMTRNITGITAVSASPDGRRVAFVANGRVYVAPLLVDNVLTMDSNVRPILSGQTATAVAWTNEVWLNVVGSAGGTSAMWRVTADGVVARSLTESLLGATVTDIVAYPSWPSRVTSDVYVMNPQVVVYLYLNSLTQESTLHAPFFGT